jgi:hypothetical protein
MYCSRADQPYLPEHIAGMQQVKWPQEFESHIFTKTEELKKTLDLLLVKYRAK